MENKSFEIRNLSFAYDDKPVLRQVDITIPKGKITTLIGPNGCGKSTLFQLLTKNLTPSGGDILLDKSILFQGLEVMRLSSRSSLPPAIFSRLLDMVFMP